MTFVVFKILLFFNQLSVLKLLSCINYDFSSIKNPVNP
jgi:hypothetical protein